MPPTLSLPRALDLPPSLAGVGRDALAFLKAGFHVVLAGAPGKTTLAQLVGHAWNEGLDVVPCTSRWRRPP